MPWLVRAVWAALPFTVGPTLAAALEGASGPVRTVASAGLWAGWAVGMVAAALAHPATLTTLRVAAPAVALFVASAALGGHPSPLAAGWSVMVVAWVFAPTLGAYCVNGPAYPDERRYLLRAPGTLLAGPLALAWGLAVGGVCGGPLLLAARRWLEGAVLTAVGAPLAVVLLRSLHNLSRRWVVFVPAGLVLHDPLSLLDPVLVRRQLVAHLRPAPAWASAADAADTSAVDLTQGAPGLALELILSEAVSLTLVRPGRRLGRPRSATAVLFTPTRPGAVLEEGRARRFPVG